MSYKKFVHEIFRKTKAMGIASDRVLFKNDGNMYRAKAAGVRFTANSISPIITCLWGSGHVATFKAV